MVSLGGGGGGGGPHHGLRQGAGSQHRLPIQAVWQVGGLNIKFEKVSDNFCFKKREKYGEDSDGETLHLVGGEEATISPVWHKLIILTQLEKITGITFNVLILDCEGCHRDFINTYKHKIATGNVNKILLGESSREEIVRK